MTFPGFFPHGSAQPSPSQGAPITTPAAAAAAPGEAAAAAAAAGPKPLYDPSKPLFAQPAVAPSATLAPAAAAAATAAPSSQDVLAKLKTYAGSREYKFGELTPEQNQQLQQAGMGPEAIKAFQGMFKTGMQDMHYQMMLDMIRHVDDVATKTRQGAVHEAGSNLISTQTIQQMEAALSYTADQNVSPLARAVLGKFLAQGLSSSDAIKAVGEYFGTLGQAAVTAGGGRVLPKASPGAPAAGIGMLELMNGQGDAERTPWLDVLGGQS